MRDASSSLVEDLSDPYDNSFEDIKTRGTISEALGGSVSFGRFLSQSLDWGRWSSFCQKSHLEEIEKCSTPGSVARKKAFFEAHYKKSAAHKSITLLEQENARENGVECHKENNANYSRVILNSAKEPNLGEEKCGLEIEDTAIVEPSLQNGKLDMIVDDIENQSKVIDMEFRSINLVDKQPLKESSLLNQEKRDSTEKRSRIPILRPTARCSNPNGNKNEVESKEKKASTLRTLHMSVNFSQERKGGTNRMMNGTSQIRKKDEESKVVSSSLKSIQNSSNITPTKATLNGVLNPASVASQSKDGRSRTPLDKRLAGRAKVDSNPYRYSVDSSKSLSNHLQSQTASSPFSFRIAERAEKQKELSHDLEHNIHGKNGKSLKLREMPKEKAESDFKKLRQSLNFKAKPLPDFYHNREPPKIETEIKKISQRKSNFEMNSSSLSARQSFKSNHSTHELGSSTSLRSKKHNSDHVSSSNS